MIRFGHEHIDGPYNVLGYGYYPGPTSSGLAGDIVLDDSENWSVNPASGIDFLEVVEHEIGHALGMAHEPPPAQGGTDAIMNPVYAGRFHGPGTSFLYQDDVNGIEALYGVGHGSVQPLDPGSMPLPAGTVGPYITSLYQMYLGRAPSQADLNNWTAVNNQAGVAVVEQGIAHSSEARLDLVRGWYQTYLGRSASDAEALGWANNLQVLTQEQALAAILGSQEFHQRAQSLVSSGSADQRYVQALYQVLLNRTASAAELSGWVNALGTAGRSGVALGFLSSVEYRGLVVSSDYATILKRTPSSTEVHGWAASSLSMSNIRDSFLLSSEFIRGL
jgi:hypothetical protein